MHVVLQAESFAEGVRRFDFDQRLAPYNLHAYQQWQNLSGYISKQTISKLSPLPYGNISITAEADPAQSKPVTAAEKQLYTQLHEGCSDSAKSGEIMVTDILNLMQHLCSTVVRPIPGTSDVVAHAQCLTPARTQSHGLTRAAKLMHNNS